MKDLKRAPSKVSNFSEKPSQKVTEIVFISIFVIFGAIGLYVVLASMKFEKDKISGTSIYEDSVIDNRSNDTKGLALSVNEVVREEKIMGKQLHIGGPLEALTPVLFEVESFNQNAEYLLDFGDGVRRVLNQRTDSHIYEEAGDYELTLYVSFQGNRRILTNKNIEIMEPITVATNATRIDF